MKIKKAIFMILIGLIFTTTDVYAKQTFPSYSSTPAGTYCKYSIGVSSGPYKDKEIYFVVSNGSLKWIDPVTNQIKSSGDRWDTDGWAKQTVSYDSSVASKMITDNVMTKCDEIFFKQSGDDLKISSELEMNSEGSSEGILMNGTAVINDTYTEIECPTIAGNTCLNGDACSSEGLPTSKVTNIVVKLKSDGEIVGVASGGYTVTIAQDVKEAKSLFTTNSCPNLYTKCSKKDDEQVCLVSRIKENVLCDVNQDDVCAKNQQKDLSKNNCKDSTEYDAEYDRILADMKAAFQSDMSGYNSYDSLIRLIGTDNCGNVGNHFNSIGSRYISQIKKINGVINCKIDAESAKKKEEEFKTTTNSIAASYVKAIENKINQLKASGAITTAQADELLKLYKCVKDQVDKAQENMISSVENFNLSEHGGIGYDSDVIDCEGLLGESVLDDINKILTWIKIGVPILLILLGSLDFGKAVISDDPKTFSKAGSNFIKRMIAAIAIFFAPFIIMYLLDHIDKIAGGCDIRDLYKGVIMLWTI